MDMTHIDRAESVDDSIEMSDPIASMACSDLDQSVVDVIDMVQVDFSL
jgi:hypothetical protein